MWDPSKEQLHFWYSCFWTFDETMGEQISILVSRLFFISRHQDKSEQFFKSIVHCLWSRRGVPRQNRAVFLPSSPSGKVNAAGRGRGGPGRDWAGRDYGRAGGRADGRDDDWSDLLRHLQTRRQRRAANGRDFSTMCLAAGLGQLQVKMYETSMWMHSLLGIGCFYIRCEELS